MSLVAIRSALETALAAMSPSLETAWENVPFSPSAAPYQAAYLMPNTPENIEYGPTFIQSGIFQVSLFYPLQVGASAAMARAELIRTAFARGSSFLNSGITVRIMRTPEVGAGTVDGDRFFIPVKIRFSAFISS